MAQSILKLKIIESTIAFGAAYQIVCLLKIEFGWKGENPLANFCLQFKITSVPQKGVPLKKKNSCRSPSTLCICAHPSSYLLRSVVAGILSSFERSLDDIPISFLCTLIYPGFFLLQQKQQAQSNCFKGLRGPLRASRVPNDANSHF